MYILSLETSTNVCSVAIHKEAVLVAYLETTIEKSHSEKITLMIAHGVEMAKIEMKDLATVAVSQGPGSYTGLRIASSTAKGLCFALDLPLIAVDTLQSMALETAEKLKPVLNQKSIIAPMIDARRMEVFTCLYSPENEPISATEAKIIDESSFEDLLADKTLFFCGNGADKCKSLIKNNNALFIENIYPSAKYIGKIAFEKYKTQSFADVVNYEPNYGKEYYSPTFAQP